MSKRTAGRCRKCGCTDRDCTDCVGRTGRPCHWVEPDLCSACTPRFEVLGVQFVASPMFAREPALRGSWIYVVAQPAAGRVEELILDAGHSVRNLYELHLPPDLWAIARRLLPRLAKKGALRL